MKSSFKCILSAALSMAIAVSSAAFAFAADEVHPDIYLGDLNTDGVVNISDATQLQRRLADYDETKAVSLVGDAMLNDIDGNTLVNVADVTELQKYLAESSDTNPKINTLRYRWADVDYIENSFEEIRVIQDAYGMRELLPMPERSGTQNGIDYEITAGNTVRLSGSAQKNAYISFFCDANGLPDWAQGGETYYMHYTNAEHLPVKAQVYYSADGSAWVNSPLINSADPGVEAFTLPEQVSGLWIRLMVDAGTTVSGAVRLGITTGRPVDDLTREIETLKEQIAALQSTPAAPQIPSYWQQEADRKIALAKQILENAGKNDEKTAVFLLSTDNHYPSDSDVSADLMAYAAYHCGISVQLNLGDILQDDALDVTGERAAESKQLGLLREIYFTHRLASATPVYLPVQGNHDDNCCLVYGNADDGTPARYPGRIITGREWTQYIQNPYSHYAGLSYGETGKYYSYDDKLSRIRFIGLDTMDSNLYEPLGTSGTVNVRSTVVSQEQLDWFEAALDTMPAGYSAVVFTHVPTHAFSDENDAVLINQGLAGNSDKVNRILESHADQIIGMFNGHYHIDAHIADKGVHYICTLNSGLYNGNSRFRQDGQKAQNIGYSAKQKGTDTETAFDIVIVNQSKRHVDMVRVGYGELGAVRSYDY